MKSTFTLLLFFSLFTLSCKDKSTAAAPSDGSEASSNIIESALSEANSHASATEGSTSPENTFLDPEENMVNLSCSFNTNRSACASNTDTINWSGCTLARGTLTGGWTEVWDACPATAGVVTTGHSVTRTSSAQTLKFSSGAYITTNTNAHTTYNGTSIPSTGINISNTAGTRTITINGLHKLMYGPHGRNWFDHSITGNLTVTGKRSSNNRIITGTQTLYHNLASYTAAHTFNNVTWADSTCCYPTSGSISSTFSGSKTGSASLSFTTTCGQATFTDTDSTASTITLTQCQ